MWGVIWLKVSILEKHHEPVLMVIDTVHVRCIAVVLFMSVLEC